MQHFTTYIFSVNRGTTKMATSKIVWTITDEAPALATYSLLPIVKAYGKITDVEIEANDISLAGRIIANFPDYLTEDQRQPDYLSMLGELTKSPMANIVKLPNISASVPQLNAAIKELQSKGYNVPDYPEDASTPQQKEVKQRYAKVLGSAVNPVLREGNSDRRASVSVKMFAKKHPHRMMKPWPSAGSKCKVAHMEDNDFYSSEKSVTMANASTAAIVFTGKDGSKEVLKENLKLQAGEVLDSAVMNVSALREFYAAQIDQAKKDGVLLSLHLKATMMKVSDPVMFGHCVWVFFRDVMEKHADSLKQIGANVNNGLADVLSKLEKLPRDKREEIQKDIESVYSKRPSLAMVD